MLVITLWHDGIFCSKRSSRYLILKIYQNQNDFGQKHVLIPASVIDAHLYLLSSPLDYVGYDALVRWFMLSKRSSRYLILKIYHRRSSRYLVLKIY